MNPTSEINDLTDNLSIQCPTSEPKTINILPTQPGNEISLIAKILSQKAINMNAFKASIIKAWNPLKKISTNLLDTNTMVFIFEDEKDMLKVCNSSWTFRDHQIIIAKWNPEKALKDIDLTCTNFWVQVYGIPAQYMNEDTAKGIGNDLGTFIKADLSAGHKWKRSLRFQILLNTTKPLTSCILLAVGYEERYRIEIRYERLTEFCYNCGIMGHKIGGCAEKRDQEGNFPINDKFGPWLRVENTLIKNPKLHHSIHNTDYLSPEKKAQNSDEKRPEPVSLSTPTIPSPEASIARDFEAVATTHPSPQKSPFQKSLQPLSISDTSDGIAPSPKTQTADGDFSEKVNIRASDSKVDICMGDMGLSISNSVSPTETIGPLEPITEKSPPPTYYNSDATSDQLKHKRKATSHISGNQFKPTPTEPFLSNDNQSQTLTPKFVHNLFSNKKPKFLPWNSPGTYSQTKNNHEDIENPIQINDPTQNPILDHDRKIPFFVDRNETGKSIAKRNKNKEETTEISIDGIGLAKPRAIHALRFHLKEAKPDVIFICEVKTSFSSVIAKALSSQKLNNHSFYPPDGNAGGIILAWGENTNLSTNGLQQNFIHTTITNTLSLNSWNFTAIYAPCHHTKKQIFWDSINNLNTMPCK
ncbi:hypothetical protein CASFOL_000842 [Castilleja foliolosa]|uniref:CCHC-type domain-containing protein n=1 Tax=Castilleja foliolosa TaxID=1961234 RepID=A0ABD3ELD7_9LAMI